MKPQLKTPLFVALDVDSREDALRIADQVAPWVGGFKIGPRLSVRYGESLLKEISQRGYLFVDNKYHDIPSTMESAIQASFDAGASFATLHTSAGTEALAALSKLEQKLCKTRPFQLLGVTVLTSFSDENLPSNWKPQTSSEHVMSLAQMAIHSGLSGLVCSAQEVNGLRKKFPQAFLLTPGIRLSEGTSGDQKRVATPAWALQEGSSALVVGRPIVEASNPKEAAQKFYAHIQEAQR